MGLASGEESFFLLKKRNNLEIFEIWGDFGAGGLFSGA
jgi:hypothetical protein